MNRKVLIIKLGYCETLINEEGFTPSLGDVFRHTVLLHHYANDHVTWLTTESCKALLQDNPFIAELLIYNKNTHNELASRSFDEILCLEKAESICNLAASISTTRYLGFARQGKIARALPGAESALSIANGGDHFLPIQALLFQMVGDYWKGENYILGYKPKPKPAYDVGLNFRVGSKWPSKAWPMAHWKALEQMCRLHKLTVSWQQGDSNLEEYMDWINAGKLIVTCDSLGMHLSLAMKKKTVALFGPTPSDSIYMYGRGIIMTSDWACGQLPCMKDNCPSQNECMNEIRPKNVARAVINLLNGIGERVSAQIQAA